MEDITWITNGGVNKNRNMVQTRGLNTFRSLQEPVPSSCEDGNEPPSYMKHKLGE